MRAIKKILVARAKTNFIEQEIHPSKAITTIDLLIIRLIKNHCFELNEKLIGNDHHNSSRYEIPRLSKQSALTGHLRGEVSINQDFGRTKDTMSDWSFRLKTVQTEAGFVPFFLSDPDKETSSVRIAKGKHVDRDKSVSLTKTT